jgi:hypothetical protein
VIGNAVKVMRIATGAEERRAEIGKPAAEKRGKTSYHRPGKNLDPSHFVAI